MFQRTDFPLGPSYHDENTWPLVEGGGVMLMSMVSTLRYTSKILGEDSNTEVALP